MTASKHPAKFTDVIVDAMREDLKIYAHDIVDMRLLDPFAGVGRAHQLSTSRIHTVGVELEREWAQQHPGTIIGDSRFLPFADNTFQVIATSPCYGNRMSDNHNAQERCRVCSGSGWVRNATGEPRVHPNPAIGLIVPLLLMCEKCDGKGRRKYTRHTYTHYLGRRLTRTADGGKINAGEMAWGKEYRELHRRVWGECARVSVRGALALINVKDFYRNHLLVDLTSWHRDALKEAGFSIAYVQKVEVGRGMGQGENHDYRVPYENVIVAINRKA